MNKYFLWPYLILLLCGSASAEGWYRWVDKEGGVHYGESPATGAVISEKNKFGAPTAADNVDMPYETRRAQQDFPVALYRAENCGDTCKKARDFLTKRGIPFTEKVLRTQEELDAFKHLSGTDSVPTLSVGKAWLTGFQAEQWGDELDAAGYPQASPYRQPAPPKPAVFKPEEQKDESQH